MVESVFEVLSRLSTSNTRYYCAIYVIIASGQLATPMSSILVWSLLLSIASAMRLRRTSVNAGPAFEDLTYT